MGRWDKFQEGFTKFKEKVSEIETEVKRQVGDFKEKHPLSSRFITDCITLLPPPAKTIAEAVWNLSEGSDEDRIENVIRHLERIEGLGEKHYEENIEKLNTILSKTEKLEKFSAKQKTLLEVKKILEIGGGETHSKLDALDSKLDSFEKKVVAKVDELKQEMQQSFEQLQRQLMSQGFGQAYISGEEITLVQKTKEENTILIEENERLKKELRKHDEKPLTNIDAELSKISYHIHVGEYSRAKDAIGEILEIDPKNVYALNDKAGILVKEGKPDDAIVLYKKALAIEPKSTLLLTNLAGVLLDLNRLDEAKSVLAEAGKNQGHEYQYLNNMGVYFEKVGLEKSGDEAKTNFDHARTFYLRAINTGQASEKPYVSLGAVHICLHELKEAIPFLVKAHEMNPSNPNIYNNMGIIYGIKGDYDLALSNFNQALHLDPNHVEALDNKKKALERKAKG